MRRLLLLTIVTAVALAYRKRRLDDADRRYPAPPVTSDPGTA